MPCTRTFPEYEPMSAEMFCEMIGLAFNCDDLDWEVQPEDVASFAEYAGIGEAEALAYASGIRPVPQPLSALLACLCLLMRKQVAYPNLGELLPPRRRMPLAA
jgi:hypothetical protein